MRAREIVAVLALAVLVLGAVFGTMAFVKSHRDAPPAPPTQQAREGATAQLATEGSPAEDYAPIWQTITRPPALKPAKAAVPKPAPKFRLKGIVSQAAGRMAIIQDSTGRQRLVAEGGAINGARVTNISPRSVTLVANGKTTVLQLERKTEAHKPNRKPR